MTYQVERTETRTSAYSVVAQSMAEAERLATDLGREYPPITVDVDYVVSEDE